MKTSMEAHSCEKAVLLLVAQTSLIGVRRHLSAYSRISSESRIRFTLSELYPSSPSYTLCVTHVVHLEDIQPNSGAR